MKTTLGIAVLGIGILVAQGCATEMGDAEDIASTKSAVTNGGIYELKGVHSNRCLDIAYGSADNGANLQIYDCWGGAPQQFKFEDMGGGYYRIRNVASNKCLDVAWASSDNGINIQQYDCHGGYNQQFRVDNSNGAVVLVARHSNKAVDVSGWGTANGTNVQQWDNFNNDTQRFYMTQVGGSTSSSSSSSSGGGGTSKGESELPSQCFGSQRLYMTAAQLAVAMAREIGEINPLRDLYVNGDRLALSWQGQNRCSPESNGCETVRAILSLQDSSVNNDIDQNTFNATTFRTTLVSQYGDQINYENSGVALPGAHSLSLVATRDAYCGTDFEFQVNWECSNCNKDEQSIKNRMSRFFRADNTVIDFRAQNGKVTIDPTGTVQSGSGGDGSGSCNDSCFKKVSSGLEGSCCTCKGKNGTYVKTTSLMLSCK